MDEYGVSIGKTSKRLVVKKRGEVVGEYPVLDVEDVVVLSRGVAITSDALELCGEHGVLVHFTDYRHQPYAVLYAPGLHGTVKTRREQFAALGDRRGVQAVKSFLVGKLDNQVNTLKYFLRSVEDEGLHRDLKLVIAEIGRYRQRLIEMDGACLEEARPHLLNTEGLAAQSYWRGVAALLRDRVVFPGRQVWDPTDPVNLMLNYGYGLLGSVVMGGILRAGLDPYGGFLHTDRSGRESLRFDLMEEFRPLVDRVIVALLRRGLKPRLVEEEGRISLEKETRRLLKERLLERFDQRERYNGQRHRLKTIIQLQARALATFLRDGKPYRPFRGKW